MRRELAEQSDRSGGILAQIGAQKARAAELAGALETLGQQLAEAGKEERTLAEKAAELESGRSAAAANRTLLQAQLAEKKAEDASLSASMEEVQERRKNLDIDCRAAEERRAGVLAQKQECEKKQAAAQEAVTSAKNTIAGYELRRKARMEKRESLQKELNGRSVELDTIASKLRMLREMEQEYEGFSRAVRLVMQESERGALAHVHGPVSKLIRVDDAYTTAIETALGAAMQNIVVDAEEDGKAAIQMLKRRDGGRATFLPLRTITGRKLQESGLSGRQGYLGLASELVRTEERYRGIVDSLLGRIAVTETLDQAIAMARAYQNRFRIVTLDGQVMNPGGSMTGGSTAKSSGVLSRANELQKLEAKRLELEQTHKALQQAVNEAASGAAKAEFELSAVQGELRQAEDEVLRRTEEEKQVALLLEALDQNIAGYEAERKRIGSRSGSDEGRLLGVRKDAEALGEKLRETERQDEALAEKQRALAEKTEAFRAGTGAWKQEAAAKDAEKSAAEQSIRQLEALSEAMQGDRAQKEKLIASYEAEAEELERQLEAGAAESRALEERTEKKRQELRAAAEARTELEGRRNKAEKDAQEKNRNILLMERETARLEQKKATGELEEKQLVDKLWDSYELTPTTAEEKRVGIESLTAAGKRITEVRRKISALGTPNLGAIEEFARVNERYEYLSGQRDDVQQSKKELETIVGSITEQMTDIFVREFARINEFFGGTFAEMFGGGKASLELEDASQPLDCGIEIRVQPPGKQLKTITLLSGGEKAFVAIALYFAILKVRPTPFCMLDEIDAALDDRNVERFAAYLRNLCGKTQFIVITHRRGTMEAADVLYGVTMQEQGISKILHINLGEMEQQLGITG